MADIRCPMCSKPNPEDAEECGFCGARLKPLVVDDQTSDETASSGATGEQEEGVPDWLNRIRARAEEETEPEAASDDEGDTDWLSRLRSVETDESGPPEDLPDWLEEEGEAESGEGEDDWLNRLRDTTADEESQLDSDGEAEPEDMDFADFEAGGQDDSGPEPDQQLRDLVADFDDQDETAEPEAADDLPVDELEAADWLAEEADESEAQEEFPDWFGDEVGTAEEDESLEFDLEASQEEPSMEAEGERPEWFDEFEQAGQEGAEELVEPTGSEPEAEETTAFEEEALPDWLDEEELEAADQFEPEATDEIEVDAAADELPSATEEEQPEVDWQEVDWEALAGEDDLEQEAMPEGLGAPPEEEEELPHVPALILDEEGEGPAGAAGDEFDLDAIELPDWLTEVDREAGAEPAMPQEDSDLAPATIPNWLEAMRPVETFRPVVDIEPEEEKAVESVGPLAGLRGVLLAEPVVAKPRTATSVGERLKVTERQYAQAEILQRIVEREDQERVGARTTSRRLPLVRWLIGLVLIVAVLLPPITGFPRFETPEVASSDLRPLLDVVNSVESGRPALVVFDYEPGYSAELEAVGSAMLYNLLARDVNIVTLSTRPTGPPLALNLVEEVGAPFEIENGRDYIHLGYLSGGPTAVQLFSVAPQEAILKGFMLPEEMELASGWEAPILRDVDQLSDFGLVAVVTAGTDNARIWAEQAHPWMGETPMVMVLSAGAEPMIRPYFESLDPQVDGILTGLPTAVYYEQQINNQPGQATGRWGSFGAGVLAVEVILVIGLFYGVVDWIIERRQESEQA